MFPVMVVRYPPIGPAIEEGDDERVTGRDRESAR